MHYILHYPSQIVSFGPLIYSWTMCHEAKLSVIKRTACHGNFKNIRRTIARHSQHALCYHLNCGERFLRKGIDSASTFTECPLLNESEEIRRHIDSLLLVLHSVWHLSWLSLMYYTWKGIHMFILENGEMYRKFGKVFDVLAFITKSCNSVYNIHLQMCDTLFWFTFQCLCKWSYIFLFVLWHTILTCLSCPWKASIVLSLWNSVWF